MDDEIVAILRVRDAGRAVIWYQRLGFAQEWGHRFAPGLPEFVSIARGRMRLFLSEHRGDARHDTLIYLRVCNVDEFAADFDVPIQQMPWAREIHLRDPDGNRLRIGTPIEAPS